MYSADEKIKWALKRYTPSGGNWPLDYKALVADFEKEHPNNRRPAVNDANKARFTIRRLIREAFTQELVRIVPTESNLDPRRLNDVEAALQNRFDSLTNAVVIRPSLIGVDAMDINALNDSVHRQLSKSVAKLISRNGILRNGDRIGYSSGRSAYHVAHFLAEDDHHSALRDIELVSLAGRLNPRHYAHSPNLSLDADYNTQEFAKWFDRDLKGWHLVRHELVCKDEPTAVAVRRNNAVFGNGLWDKPLDIAILGIGVLRPGHRMYDIAAFDLNIWPPATELAPILPDLKGLIALSDKYSSAEYCPVADVANHLFTVPPVPPVQIPKREWRRIVDLIARINGRTLTVSEKHIQKMKNIIFISGTRQKCLAAREFLLNHDNVRYFCTDVDSASHILQADVASSAQSKICVSQSARRNAHKTR